MIALVNTDEHGTQIDLYDAATIDELHADTAAHWETLTDDEPLDQPAVAELLADHHWQMYSGWGWDDEFGTYCVVYQTS